MFVGVVGYVGLSKVILLREIVEGYVEMVLFILVKGSVVKKFDEIDLIICVFFLGVGFWWLWCFGDFYLFCV